MEQAAFRPGIQIFPCDTWLVLTLNKETPNKSRSFRNSLSAPLPSIGLYKPRGRQNDPLFACNPITDKRLSKSKVSKWEQTTHTLYGWPHAPLVPGLSYTFWPFFWYNLLWEVVVAHWKLLQGVSLFSHFGSKLRCSTCQVRSGYSGSHLGLPMQVGREWAHGGW